MPTGAYNRKYVYLSPKRAKLVADEMDVVITAKLEKLATLEKAGHEWMYLDYNVRVLRDCVMRLRQQETKAETTQTGVMSVPATNPDVSEKLTLLEIHDSE